MHLNVLRSVVICNCLNHAQLDVIESIKYSYYWNSLHLSKTNWHFQMSSIMHKSCTFETFIHHHSLCLFALSVAQCYRYIFPDLWSTVCPLLYQEYVKANVRCFETETQFTAVNHLSNSSWFVVLASTFTRYSICFVQATVCFRKHVQKRMQGKLVL